MRRRLNMGLNALLIVGLCGPLDALAAVPTVVKAMGTLEPQEVVDVNAAVPGIIRSIGDTDTNGSKSSIQYGSIVKKGQVLARLDPTSYLAALDQSRADLARTEAALTLAKSKTALADRELQRVATREEGKPERQGDVEVAKAALDVAHANEQEQMAAIGQAKSAVRRAEIAVDNCTIRSPIDGEVLAIRINTGQAVAVKANSPSLFLLMADRNQLQVWASVNEREIGKVAVGQLARFTVLADPSKTYTGKVSQVRLNAQATQNTVSYTVVIELDKQTNKLLPYLTAEVEIETEE